MTPSVPSPSNSCCVRPCFFNSTSHYYSKEEVITLVVLGVLSLIMTAAGLYGYLVDPSWMAGAHVLTALTFLTWSIAGALVLIKCIQNRRHLKSEDDSVFNANFHQKGE